MRNKDTGEFELVVGDKQLLSGFFIGVLLLAVVFAMGYVLGQSSPKSAKVPSETAVIPNSAASDSHPSPAGPVNAEPGTMTPPATAGDAAPAAGGTPAETPPQPTTVPAREAEAPAPAPPPKPARPVEPENANYWQVLAGSPNSADAMIQTLKGQGFPASTRPGPNNLTLVWVGPYTDKESLTRAKKRLEDAGMKPIRKP